MRGMAGKLVNRMVRTGSYRAPDVAFNLLDAPAAVAVDY